MLSVTPATAAGIAVTLPPLAGLVSMLDAEAEVICLLPNGADPHSFQLSPRKIEMLRKTALLVRASRDDGGWPLPPEHGHTLDLWPEIDHGWLSPAAVREILPRLADALITLHPKQQASIKAALLAAQADVDLIDAQWRRALAGVREAGVIMQHPAWRRLMLEMGVPVLDVLESGHHGHEHGPHALEEALTHIGEHPGAWLLADAGHGNRALSWLRDHADGRLHWVRLDALGSCSEGWVEQMQRNLELITAEASR